MLQGKCIGLPPEMFILDRGHQPQQAMDICNGVAMGEPCVVRDECKAYGAATGSVGVWGGEYVSSRDYGVEDALVEAIIDLTYAFVAKIEQDARPHPVTGVA